MEREKLFAQHIKKVEKIKEFQKNQKNFFIGKNSSALVLNN